MGFVSPRSWGTYWELDEVVGCLRGWEEPPLNQVGCGREGRRVEAGWDQCPLGEAGGGEMFPGSEWSTGGGRQGISGDRERPSRDGGLEGNVARASPNCSGPREPAGVLGLNPPAPTRLLLASWVPGPEPPPQPGPLPAKWVAGPKP